MKLHVATPMYGGNCTAGYASSVINLSRLIPFEHNFVTNESLVTRARNMLAHVFLASDATHLLFIDADVAFDAQGICKMIESDKDVIGGLYAKKHINWDKARMSALHGANTQQMASCSYDYYVRGNVPERSSRPVEVDSIGTGLLLIKRGVFESLQDKTTVSKLGSQLVGQIASSDMVYHFFETGLDENTGEFLSEDYAFCQKWKASGGKVFAAPWVETVHIGTHHFG